MKLLHSLFYRCRWLNAPGLLLVALLQRTPVLRVAAAGEEIITSSPLAHVLRAALTGIASLGAVHALAGATQWVLNPGGAKLGETPTVSVSAMVGTPTSLVFTVSGALTPAGSYRISGTLPPGLTAPGINSNGVVNTTFTNTAGTITGTPTVAGNFTVSVTAYEFANGPQQPLNDSYGPLRINFAVTGGATVAPSFTQQPVSQTVAVGASVTFTAAASGSPAPTFQWRLNGVNILGATQASLIIPNAQVSNAGTYTVVASNSAPNGTATSSAATLTVDTGSVQLDPSARLSNLSVRTTMAVNQTLIVGVTVGGGPRQILVRAAGPALAGFGLANTMTDPRLDLFRDTTLTASNDNWDVSLRLAFASVGAFDFQTGSRDAAFSQTLDGGYTIQARGTGAGLVLVEAYDLGNSSTPRLTNVSARNFSGTGDNILIAGFNITGSGTGLKQLLIRAVGPKLGAFGVAGFLADPKLEIYSGAEKLTENDNWAASLAPTFAAVGAFALDPGSRDAALVTALPPGGYTVQVKGADGGTGEALIEIYELP